MGTLYSWLTVADPWLALVFSVRLDVPKLAHLLRLRRYAAVMHPIEQRVVVRRRLEYSLRPLAQSQ